MFLKGFCLLRGSWQDGVKRSTGIHQEYFFFSNPLFQIEKVSRGLRLVIYFFTSVHTSCSSADQFLHWDSLFSRDLDPIVCIVLSRHQRCKSWLIWNQDRIFSLPWGEWSTNSSPFVYWQHQRSSPGYLCLHLCGSTSREFDFHAT